MSAENGALAPNGIWKWIAAILVAILIAGAPGIVQAVKAPSRQEVDMIRERQVQVLIRLSRIETQLTQLQLELRRHQDSRAR